MKGVFLIGLLILTTFGIASLASLLAKNKDKLLYDYDYQIKGSYNVGSTLLVTSMDTIPPTKESGGIIQVSMTVK